MAAQDPFPRPTDHPSELPWPPILPSYATDSPAWSREPSISSFNHDLATKSFGASYIDAIGEKQRNFRGDWWILAALSRCKRIARENKNKEEHQGAVAWWNSIIQSMGPRRCYPHLERAHLNRAHLEGMYFGWAVLDEATFTNAHMKNCDLSRASLMNTNLTHAHIENGIFTDSQLDRTWLDAANLAGTQLIGATGSQASFVGASLKGALIQGAMFQDTDFRRADLTECNASTTSFVRCDLRKAILIRAQLDSTNFQYARMRRCDLRYSNVSGARITNARLVGAIGLFGRSRAIERDHKINEHESQDAVYKYKPDFLSWEWLRLIGSLRLFGVSYLSIAAITFYAAFARQYNLSAQAARLAAQQAIDTNDQAVGFWSRILSELPLIPLPAHLGNQLIATILVALAATLHALACPAEVKEANEVRWTRAMGQPLWEYRSANWSRFWFRYVTGALFALGGGYSLYYLGHRSFNAIRYLLLVT